MRTLVDILKDYQKIRNKYLMRIDYYLNLIKKRAQKLLGKDVKVYLFGSYIKGNFGPLSDVDVLVVSDKVKQDPFEIAQLKIKLTKGFEIGHPFEIHLTNNYYFENWYKKFIKKDIKEIK